MVKSLILKWIDKFLAFLKTDRNTFATYVLTLATIYIVVDRVVELIFLMLTGISSSYWGPFAYTFALACPVFAYFFSGSSKFTKGADLKITYFYIYVICLYVVALSMFTQWLNAAAWIAFSWVPNYSELITEFSDLVKPAFSSICLWLPFATFIPVFKFLYLGVADTLLMKDSIKDYGGIDLSDKKVGTGPYTCEVVICKEGDTGKPVKVPEAKRFESTLVVGTSGTGKTTMVFEPMIARDLEKKHFFREAAKELGYTALKTGIATLNSPYDNEYMNKNFSLNMIKPKPEKEKIYKTYISKLTQSYDGIDSITYRNLGLTYLAPDFESLDRVKDVAKNFNIPVHIVDPMDPNSIGINPFVNPKPMKVAVTISSVLKGMYETTHNDFDEAFRENIVVQAVENVTLLLKEMYPRLNSGTLPNLEDMQKLLNNFDLVEAMAKEMVNDPELSEKYSVQLAYFKKNFFRGASGRADTEKYLHGATTQLDNILRVPGVKAILCNRTNNIDYEKALENGEAIFVCTRRGDLGAIGHKAFGLFFLLSMQYSVLTRYGNEKTRIPHFLYIDEFADYVCKATMPMFTMYRKYRVGNIISSQNLAQIGKKDSALRQTILGNCTTKMIFGGNTPDENEYWQKELSNKRDWKFTWSYDMKSNQYDSKAGGVNWGWKDYFEDFKVMQFGFKSCAYKTRDLKGKHLVGPGKVDFLESKYKAPQEEKNYNFYKYAAGISGDSSKKQMRATANSKNLLNQNRKTDNALEEIDPVRTDATDSSYFFNSDDAITFNLKKENNNNN